MADIVTLAIEVRSENAQRQLNAFQRRLEALSQSPGLHPEINIGGNAIRQIDRIQQRLNRMQGDIPVRVRGAERAHRSLNQINSTLGGLSRFAKGATAALAGIFTVSAITKGATDAVKAFSDMQEESQKFGVVFSSVSKEAKSGVDDLVRNFGQSELAATRMMAQTGDLLKGFGMADDDIVALSAGIAKMGSDIASFTNYSGGAEQATFALTKAMLGETEQAKSLGVAIKTDTPEYRSLAAQAQTTGVYIAELGRTFKASSAQEGKAIAAAATIYEQKAHVLGDFSRNQDSIANQSRILGNRLLDLKINIGAFLDSVIHTSPLISYLAGEVKRFSDTLKTNGAQWSKDIQILGLNIAEVASQTGVYLEPVFTWIGAGIKNIVSIGKWAFDNMVPLVENFGSIAAAIGTDILDFFLFIPRAIMDSAETLVNGGFENLRLIVSGFVNLVVTSWKSTFTAAGNILSSFGRNWRGIFTDMFEIGKRTLASIWDYFVSSIKNIGTMAASLGSNFWSLITGKKSFTEAIGGILDDYTSAMQETAEKVKKNWDGFEFGASTKAFGQDIVNEIAAHNQRVAAAAADGFKPVWENTKKVAGELGDNLARRFGEVGKNLPKVLKDIGTTPLPDLASGNGRAWTDADYRRRRLNENTAYYENLRNRVKNGAQGNNADIQDNGKELAKSIGGVAKAVKNAGKGFATAAEAIEYGSAEAVKMESMAYFSSPASNAENAIVKSGNNLSDAINEVAGNVRNAGKKIPHSKPNNTVSSGVSFRTLKSSGGNTNIRDVMAQLKDAVIQLKSEVANTKQIRSDVKAIRQGIPENNIAFV